ncbi:MAG: asparagine synthase, partial [Flavobacteriales bacterium]|nr:asparagine synthase [Flavobacteriales bacterium]
SGGYDSRLIAVMLKKHGIDNVICYTYGKENNFELNNSEKVANELGFDWIFVPYNEKIFDNYLEGEEFDEYKDYAGKFSSMPFLQEYFAIRYLRDEKIIPHDSVIISGYAGDFLGGSQAVKVYSDKETDESMLNLLSNKLNIYNKNEKVNFDLIMSDVKHSLNLFSTTSESIIYTTIEDYLVKERLSKFIFNAASIYTFFGYEHRFPFWDMELLNHFKSVPYEFKKGKRLYDDVLKNYFFEPYNVNFKEEIQASVFDLIKKKVKDKIKIVLPYSVKVKLLNNYDWIDSKGATYPMLMDLQSNGIVFKDDTVGYNSRIIQWYLWKCKQAIEQKNNETI